MQWNNRGVFLRTRCICNTNLWFLFNALSCTPLVIFCKSTGRRKKKRSCPRETERCLVSLNISLSVTQCHSNWHPLVRRVEVSISNTRRVEVFHSILFHLVPFLRHSASNNGVTLVGHPVVKKSRFSTEYQRPTDWRDATAYVQRKRMADDRNCSREGMFVRCHRRRDLYIVE